MRIQGQIEEGVIVNLLQYLNLNSATGVLRLQSPHGASGAIYTDTGEVVHASVRGHVGMPAMVALFGWHLGRFAFQSNVRSPERSIDKSFSALLLEVAYQTDHGLGLGEPALSSDTVLVRRAIPEAGNGRKVALSLTAIRMLPYLDGVATLEAVAVLLETNLATVSEAATLLLDNDLVEVSGGEMVPADAIADLTDLARDIMGPLADIVVDESLDELGVTAGAVPAARLSALLELLETEFPAHLREAFMTRARRLLEESGVRYDG